MAGNHSTEQGESGERSLEQRLGRRFGQALRGLGPNEKLASLGVFVVTGSLLLPWYGAPIATDLVQTGIGAFNFATAALLVTVGAVIFLCTEVGDGYRPPRPFSVGSLLVAGGVWAGLIVLFLIADRPQFDSLGVEEPYNVRYGIFVALAGAAMIALAGMRRRANEETARVAHADDDLGEIEIEPDEE